MVDSLYQQPFANGERADESSDEDLTVQDDELLIGDGPVPAETRRWGSAMRSRRAPRSGARPARPRAGEVLAGKYRIEAVCGRSGPEMVVFARHLELDQRVRLRYLLPEASASPEAVARFQRGARKAREMRSEQAERIIDFGRFESGSPYRVTEMPSGPSLEEMLRVRGALDIAEAVDILISTCEPVAEAHAAGVVHRSLSTSSIFVERRADGSKVVKVVDFGVADPLEPDPAQDGSVRVAGHGAVEGALAFSSPEQIRNVSAVDGRTDVWALGAVLYELLTGVRVFEAETPLTLLAMIAADQPAPIHWLVPEIPEGLERVVLACLEKERDARPRSVVELAHELAPFGSGEAQSVAGRVQRIALRSTRPPPLPGAPSRAPNRAPVPRTRAIVRATPAVHLAEPEKSGLPGWATATGGALIGISAALMMALLFRLQLPQQQPAFAPAPGQAPAPVTATAPSTAVAPAPVLAAVPVAQPTAAQPAVAPLAPALVAPAAAIAVAPAPSPPPVVQRRPAKRVETEPKAEAASERSDKARPERKAPPAETVAGRSTAAPKTLFGGID